jgi:hypothetical protein
MKRQLNSISTRIILLLILALTLTTCGDEYIIIDCFPKQCGIPANVVNLEGQDACGMVFQLSDGTYLIPEKRTYTTAPSTEEDPIYYFDLEAGQKVKLGFKKSAVLTSCMSGKVVFITCIREVKGAVE